MLWWTLRQLRSKDAGTRAGAALKLGESKDWRALEPLAEALSDGVLSVRYHAALALRKMVCNWPKSETAKRIVPALVAALADKDSSTVREAAAEALWPIGDARAVEPLLAALEDESCGVRQAAVHALWCIADRRAVEPLMAALKDEDSEVRRAAAELLGRISDPRAMEPLLATLMDGDWRVNEATEEALRRIDPHWAKSEVAERAVRTFVAALQGENWHVRVGAMVALQRISDPRAVEPVLAALKDEDWRVRRAAAWTLGRIADARAVEPLAAALKDEYSEVRKAAAEVLERIGDRRAVEPLVAALKDGDSDVREAAGKALDRIDPRWPKSEAARRAVAALVAALKDGDSDVRRAAAEALKLLGWRAPVGGLPSSVIVFRTGTDQPQNPLAYTQQIFSRKYQCDAGKVELDAWRIVGVRNEPDADSARRIYVQLKGAGQLPDFGPLTDSFEGKGPDGRTVVAFFFGGAAAGEAPPARIALDVNNPACTLCGKALAGGESILAGASTLITSRPAGELHDDYALFRGSVCFNCRVVLCTDCLGKRVDQCPKCNGGTKPAYRHYLRELAAL
jgi:HEAT repeat protein